MKIIAIAGGSGSGKSSVAHYLVETHPEIYGILNFDDYQKVSADTYALPKIDDIVNWDHPDVIRWDDVISDVQKLKRGKSITLQSWSDKSNPDYYKNKTLVPLLVNPMPVMIVEGYMCLYDDRLNDLYDKSFYFDVNQKVRNKRRREARGGKDSIIGVDNYIDKVLNPMHQLYVEPTKEKADSIVKIENKSIATIGDEIHKSLF